MSSFSFPLLEVSDLLDTLKDIIPDLDLCESDFGKPKRERWESIYQSVLASTTFCCMETLFQPPHESLIRLDHVELYEKAIPTTQLFKAMQKLMLTCFVDDFNQFDILEPKPNRLRKICSALVNYMRFFLDRLPAIDHIKEESKEMEEQREMLLKQNNQLQTEINQIKATRSMKQPEIDQMKERICAKTARLNELQQEVAKRKQHSDSIKTQIAQTKAKTAKVLETLAVRREESNRLSGLIVQSPERMKSDMDRMHTQLAKLKRDKDEKVTKHVDMKRLKEQFTQNHAECEQAFKLLSDINEATESEKKVLAEITNIRDQVQAKKEQLSNLHVEEKQVKRILTSKQEKLSKMTLQNEGRFNGLKEDIDELKQKISMMRSIHSAEESEVAKIQGIRRQLVESDERAEQQSSAELSRVAEKYSQLLEQLDNYHTRLGETWESLKSQMENQ